jgi:hypothetical protein
MGLPGLAQCVASRATLGEGWSGRPAPSPNPAPALPFGRSSRSGSASKHAGAGLLDRLSVVRKESCAFEGARVRRGRATAIVCAVPVAGVVSKYRPARATRLCRVVGFSALRAGLLLPWH